MTLYDDMVLADGPVGYWPLTEANEPFNDVVGTNHLNNATGSTGNHAGPVALGAGDRAALNPTATDYLGTAAGSTLLNAGSVMTAEIWIYYTGTKSAGGPITMAQRSPGTGTMVRYSCGLNAAMTAMEAWNGSAARTSGAFVTPILNRWVHLAYVWSGGQITFYADGVALGVAQSLGLGPNQNQRLFIGGGYAEAFYCFTGYTAKPALYDKALTADQIANRHWFGRDWSRYGWATSRSPVRY